MSNKKHINPKQKECWVEIQVDDDQITYHDILRFNGRVFIKREKLKEFLANCNIDGDIL